eukprot:SAG11_NODE_3049_length_2732_cov_1.898595_2_plen_172_part_00
MKLVLSTRSGHGKKKKKKKNETSTTYPRGLHHQHAAVNIPPQHTDRSLLSSRLDLRWGALRCGGAGLIIILLFNPRGLHHLTKVFWSQRKWACPLVICTLRLFATQDSLSPLKNWRLLVYFDQIRFSIFDFRFFFFSPLFTTHHRLHSHLLPFTLYYETSIHFLLRENFLY